MADSACQVILANHQQSPRELAGSLDYSVPRPQTPTHKHIQTNWHGLFSPYTPSCDNEADGQHTTLRIRDDHDDSRSEPLHSWSSENKSAEYTGRAREASVLGDISHDRIPDSPVSPLSSTRHVTEADVEQRNGHMPQSPASSIERDIDLALELEALPSPSSARRSSRLRNKTKTKTKGKSALRQLSTR